MLQIGDCVLGDFPLLLAPMEDVSDPPFRAICKAHGADLMYLEVVQRLQDVGVQAITIHGRTRQQMYKGSADWSYIAVVKADPTIHIPIFGNGDIDSPAKAVAYKNEYGVDGMMLGRASIGYPWIFREIKHYHTTGSLLPPPTLAERIETVKNIWCMPYNGKENQRAY